MTTANPYLHITERLAIGKVGWLESKVHNVKFDFLLNKELNIYVWFLKATTVLNVCYLTRLHTRFRDLKSDLSSRSRNH